MLVALLGSEHFKMAILIDRTHRFTGNEAGQGRTTKAIHRTAALSPDQGSHLQAG
jgi:hypothetical protein